MTNENIEYEEITLLRNPILTLKTLSVIIVEQGVNLVKFITSHKSFLLAFILYVALNFIEGLHAQVYYFNIVHFI
jgi:hypothetical protein